MKRPATAVSFTSAPFTYNGAAGRQPRKVAVSLKRLAFDSTKVNVTATASFTVAILNASGLPVVQPFHNLALTPTSTFTKVGPMSIRRNVLRKGQTYRVRITSAYVDGAQVLKSADAYYERVRLVAKRHLKRGQH